jgi:signal transduction histidine kinase
MGRKETKTSSGEGKSIMEWTNWLMLGVGLGTGAIGGWIAATQARQQGKPQNNQHVSSASEKVPPSVAIPHTSTVDSTPSALSEVKTLKDELQRTQLAYQMAKEMGQFQAGFLARTSHELRSPINSTISLHQLILADLCEDPAEEREFVAQANTAAQKMLALMDHLTKVSKATYGTEQLKIQPVSLIDALLEAHQFTSLQAKNRNLGLEIEIPEEEVFVSADPNWLRQVLVGLIDAAISQMQEGSIRLSTQTDAEAGFAHFWIEDDRPIEAWQEPIDLLNRPSSVETDTTDTDTADTDAASPPNLELTLETLTEAPSPSLTLLVSQMILEQMNGRLELCSTPSDTHSRMRVRCSVPIAPS